MIRVLRILPALFFISPLLALYLWLSPIHFGAQDWNPHQPPITIDHEAEKYQRLNCILHAATIPGNTPLDLLSSLTDTPKPLAAEDFKKIRSQYPSIQYKFTVDTPPSSRDSAYTDIHNPFKTGSSVLVFRLASWNPSTHRFHYSLKLVAQNSAAVAFAQRHSGSNLELAISTRFYKTPFEILHPNSPPSLDKYTVTIPVYQEVIRYCPADRSQTYAWILPDPGNSHLLMILELNPPPSTLKTLLMISPILPLPK